MKIEKIKKTTLIAIMFVIVAWLIFFSANQAAEASDYIIGDHEFIIIDHIEPTCRDNGRIVRFCIYCGDIYTEILPAIDCRWGLWTTEIEPTCTEPGLRRRTCDISIPHSEEEEVPYLGHEFEERIRKEPSCEARGELGVSCEQCDYYRTAYFGAPLGHTFVSNITREPLCGVDGEITFSCEYCEESYIESIPALSHEWSQWIIEYYPEEGVEGKQFKYCMFCDQRIEEIIPPLPIPPPPPPEPPPPPFFGVEEMVVIGSNILLWILLAVFLMGELTFLLWGHRRKKQILIEKKSEEDKVVKEEEEMGYELI